MSKSKSAKQPDNWLVKRNAIKSEIKRMMEEAAPLRTDALSSGEVVGSAKSSLESFIYQNGGSESAVPSSKKGDLERLKLIYEEAKEKAIPANFKYKEAVEKIEQLEKELIEIYNIARIQSFNAGNLEAFVMESVSPFFKDIREKISKLNALISKRAEFQDELEGLKMQPPKLDTDNLLQVSIAEYTTATESYKQIKDSTEPVKDLIGQISQAIDNLGKQITDDQKSFASIVIDAVNVYTIKARNDFAAYLKMIIEKDREYVQCVNQLLKTLEAEANKGIESNSPVEPIVFLNRHFKERDARMIQDLELVKEIEKTANKISFNPQ
jgi:hypothetical protein